MANFKKKSRGRVRQVWTDSFSHPGNQRTEFRGSKTSLSNTSRPSPKTKEKWVTEIAQQLRRALAALKGSSSVSRKHMQTHNHL